MNHSKKIMLTIIIVSYNCRRMTLDTIRSVYNETSVPFELICLDNNSSDGTSEAIVQEFPQVLLRKKDKNIGFAAGNNEAASQAKGNRILLLNPDTVIIDNAIDKLWSFAEKNPSAKIWGGRTLFADGTLNRTSCWGKMTLWSLFCRTFFISGLFAKSEFFNPVAIGDWQRDSVREVDIVTGCFFMIDTLTWKSLGGFNTDFFMYGEEADLCLRAKALGAHPTITPDSTIIHHGGGSEVSTADKLIKVLKGNVTLMNVHWSPIERVVGYWLFLIMVFIRCLGNLFFKPRTIAGTGADGKINSWREAYRRRDEWINGWPLSSLVRKNG